MRFGITTLLLLLAFTQPAHGEETVYYLMKARTMGSGVPAGLNTEVLTKIRRVVSKHNRLVVEGEVDSMAVEGPVIPAKKLAMQLEEARLAFEGLEFEKARNLASDVLAAIGSLPATPAGRGLWRQAQIRLIAIADGEGNEDETTRRVDELLRIEPGLDPSAMGVEPHLVDLLIAAKARVPASVPVRLRLSPPGAKAWLDGQPAGTKPRARPGAHRVMVKRAGYAAYVGSFTAREGLPVEV
ncbi:MAG: hypothetical protein CMH55_04140, partial [Myxococcales bacterium]|nr:hypothetical protein [Myxococcales bacterium]